LSADQLAFEKLGIFCFDGFSVFGMLIFIYLFV